MNNFRLSIFVSLLVCFLSSLVWAKGLNQVVHFESGKNTTTLKNSLVRGDEDHYVLGAKAGQQMSVRISSLEKNAVFQIYIPGYQITTDAYGHNINGTTHDKAGISDNATAWKGPLPASGDYLIIVGSTRGNTTYQLDIVIQ